MAAQNMYFSEYTNEFGEEWIFQFNPATGHATIKGSDIDWQEYAVSENGNVPFLILNEGELAWLKESWDQAKKKFADL